MARKEGKAQTNGRSLLAAILFGAMSVMVGFGAYKLLNPEVPEASQKLLATEKQVTPTIAWPEVQNLAPSGIKPTSEAELIECKKKIKLLDEKSEIADITNYGDRYEADAIGRAIPNRPEIIVVHETVIPVKETVDLFKTPHENDSAQASYHVVIGKLGGLIRIVEDDKRAFGSGYSKFGDFTVHSKSPETFSINNVALHISLETPADGQGDSTSHSGYTKNQYESLAKKILYWQAKYGIPVTRITTHASVDRSHSRYDPRAFRWDEFDHFHRQYAKACRLSKLSLPL